SVRTLSREWQVSVTTVMQAYRILENRGLVEARPQSGFYVLPTFRLSVPEPRTTSVSEMPCDVSVSAMSQLILKDAENPALLQLGAALQNPALVPARKLHRMMGVAARRWPDRGVNYCMSPGTLELRTEIARRAITAGCVFSPD